MRLPKELTTVTTVSKMMALIILIMSVIVAFLMGRNYEQSKQAVYNTYIDQNISVYKPAPASKTTKVKPTEVVVTVATAMPTGSPNIDGWQLYDKSFGNRIHVKMYYPPMYELFDNDPDSGGISINPKGKAGLESVYMDTVQSQFGFTDTYTGGSRREWFLSMLKKYRGINYPNLTPVPIDFSQVQFKEITVAGGNSYLEVSNFPKESDLSYYNEGGKFYIGVQNGIFFCVISTLKDQNTTDSILYSIGVSAP